MDLVKGFQVVVGWYFFSMFLSGCNECGVAAASDYTSPRYFSRHQQRRRRRRRHLHDEWHFITTFVVGLLFVGTLASGEKVTTRTKGIVTTKDITNENDNFRARRGGPHGTDKNENKNSVYDGTPRNKTTFHTERLLNSHRKSLFARVHRFKNIKIKSSKHKKDIDYNSKQDIYTGEERPVEFSSSWAVKLPDHLHKDGHKHIADIAEDIGLTNHGNIGHLAGHFLLVHHTFYNRSSSDRDLGSFGDLVTRTLQNHPRVEWVEREIVLKRKKRSLEFKDEFFPSQWHLVS